MAALPTLLPMMSVAPRGAPAPEIFSSKTASTLCRKPYSI